MNKTVLGVAAAAVVALGAWGVYTWTGQDTPVETVEVAAQDEALEASHEVTHDTVAKIAWYEGSVDEAFAQSAAEDTPILLYWGAEWCPPCAQLKATIFKRSDFIEKTKLYIPVYLDGDTDRAQVYGEKFGVRGYPTLIVFNPQGDEVTRIPGGMNLEAYASVLDWSLNDMRSVSELVASIMDEGYTPNLNETRLLAHYSWGQDGGKALGERDKAEVFKRMSAVTPDGLIVEKSRFDTRYIDALVADEEVELDDETKAEIVERYVGIVKKPLIASANQPFVAYSSENIIKAVSDEGSPQREELISIWADRLAAFRVDGAANMADRLRTYMSEIGLQKLRDGKVSESFKIAAREAVERERAGAADAYEAIVATNMAFYILTDTDQADLANEILTAELEKSDTGFYWMLDLADIAEEAERTDEAVAWLAKAYNTSTGLATRAQWGSYYVDGLTRMKADDATTIETAALSVLGELDAQSDPFHGRNKSTVKRVGKALTKWAETEDRQVVLDRVNGRYGEICGSHFDDEEGLQACTELFTPPEA